MSKSILNSIKKLLGIDSEYDAFDEDIRIHINSAFSTLQQLGVGPRKGFVIAGPEEEWDSYISDSIKLESVKSYIYLRVRLLFDPPSHSFLIDSLSKQAKELEWRLSVQVEEKNEEP